MYSNTTGSGNIAFGTNALTSNTNGSNNSALGVNGLNSNTTGAGNIAVGTNALFNNTSGANNVSQGLNSMNNNTTGGSNVAIGAFALEHNVAKNGSVAIGYEALKYAHNTSTSSFSGNVAIGHQALHGSTTASSNTGGGLTALGSQALFMNSSGTVNTAVGQNSLSNNSSGSFNTALGQMALNNNVTGSQNTALGQGANVQLTNQSNSTAIGFGAVSNSSNKIRIGNSAVTVIEGQVDWSWPSDGRFKSDINENIPGLDLIMKLRPVSYKFDTRKFDQHLKGPDSDKNGELPADYFEHSSGIVHTGFIAQEVDAACAAIGFDFNAIHKPDSNNPGDHYSIAYTQFIMPIVKAIQEQQYIINQLKSENETLRNFKNEFEKMAAEILLLKTSIEAMRN
jgi:hypothetical protein